MPDATPRSQQVTILAWNVILVGLIASGLGALQLAIVLVLLPPDALRMTLEQIADGQPVPGVMFTIVDHFTAILAGVFATGVVTLVAGVGLLKRREWGRVIVIWMMILNIAAHAVAVVLPFATSSTPSTGATTEAPPVDGQTQLIVTLLTFVLVVAVCWLSWWVIRLLRSDAVHREFQAS